MSMKIVKEDSGPINTIKIEAWTVGPGASNYRKVRLQIDLGGNSAYIVLNKHEAAGLIGAIKEIFR